MTLRFTNKINRFECAGYANDMDISNDGKLLAIANFHPGPTPKIQIFNTETGEVAMQAGHEHYRAYAVAFGPGARFLFYLVMDAAEEKILFVRYKLKDGSIRVIQEYEKELGPIYMARNFDSSLLAVSGDYLEVWSTKPLVVTWSKEAKEQDDIRCAFAHQEPTLYCSGLFRSRIQEIDLETGEKVKKMDAPCSGNSQLIVSPNNEYLMAFSASQWGMYLFDAHSRERIAVDEYHDGTVKRVLIFDQRGDTLFGFQSSGLFFVNLKTGEDLDGPEIDFTLTVAATSALEAPIIAVAEEANQRITTFQYEYVDP